MRKLSTKALTAITAMLLIGTGAAIWSLSRTPIEQRKANRLEVQAVSELATLIERVLSESKSNESNNEAHASLHGLLTSFDWISELPKGYEHDGQTNQIKNQWGQEVSVAYAGGMKHYTIFYASMPKKACRYLAGQLPYGQLRSMGRGEGIGSNNAITMTLGHVSPFAINEMCQPDALNRPLYFSTRELL